MTVSESPSSNEDLATRLSRLDLIKNFVDVHDIEIKLHEQYIKAVKSRDKKEQLRLERLIKDHRDRYAILASDALEFADDLEKELNEW